jgi:hypothetical protein
MRSKVQDLVTEAIRSNNGEDLDEVAACVLVQDVLTFIREEMRRIGSEGPHALDGFRIHMLLDSLQEKDDFSERAITARANRS